MVWEGEGVIKYGHKLIRATDQQKSEPGTIRGDLTVVVGRSAGTTAGKEDGGASSSCLICLDAPTKGACIPCGHMVGCMSCLNEIKAKKWSRLECLCKFQEPLDRFSDYEDGFTELQQQNAFAD